MLPLRKIKRGAKSSQQKYPTNHTTFYKYLQNDCEHKQQKQELSFSLYDEQ